MFSTLALTKVSYSLNITFKAFATSAEPYASMTSLFTINQSVYFSRSLTESRICLQARASMLRVKYLSKLF